MLLTKEAYRQKEKELEELNQKLQEVRKEKALQISQSDGDDRHDNFGFEQAEIQERAIIKDIRDLTAQLRNETIVEKEVGFIGECKIANDNKVKIQIMEIN